ncbi:hypothetical protein F975_01679 [Acinetobacter sp. ANC 3789]|uniref:hypothetical protein n=1 Tax=Acinetobacter sp. ANC 3789 TaxID=1217714 RepID=UPI0002D02BE5|nr:hypothetical protein [Acinetobacter sp. ANC 3789]ENU80625.1 hypothetical protein F975_01679 [Acinetobacter sp. ANC 3789]
MNTKLVAVQEAFKALLAGKNILVRSTESTLLTDFRPVSEFAADIWAKVGFEFTIEIEKIEVAGIHFTKPLTLADVEDGQDVYVIEPMTGMYWYKYNPTIQALNAAIERGFAQADTENARLQLEAFSKLMGRECGEVNVLPVAQDESKQRKTRKKKEDQELKDIPANEPVYTQNDQNSASNDVEKKTSTDKAELKIDELQESVKAAENHFTYEQKLNDLIDRAASAKTVAEANALVKYTTDWTEDQRKPLLDTINKRLVELDAQNKEMPPTPPSLMVQIENAPDLTTLDALEIDVSARHPDIQPKLMGYIRKRCAELEN